MGVMGILLPLLFIVSYMCLYSLFAFYLILATLMGVCLPYINLYVYLFQVVFILCRNFLYV